MSADYYLSPSFSASLAAFSELTNDERTRTFLAAEVGAGHDQVRPSLCFPLVLTD